MDTIIIVIKDSDDCLRLKEFLSSDYHIVICSELENIIDNLLMIIESLLLLWT